MAGQQLCKGIEVDPDFVVAFFLGFIKDQFQPKMQMRDFYIVDIFLCTLSGVSHIADHLSGRNGLAFLQPFCKRPVLPQVGIVIIPPSVSAWIPMRHPPY